MKLKEILLIVEYPAAAPQIEPRDILGGPIGDEIGVKLGPDLGDQAAGFGAVFVRIQIVDVFMFRDAVQILAEDRKLVSGFQRQTGANDDRLHIVVEEDADKSVFQRGHDDRFIDKRVFGAAHSEQVLAKKPLLVFRHLIDDQHFEIRPPKRPRLGRQSGFFLVILVVPLVPAYRDRATAVCARGQGARDAAHRGREVLDMSLMQKALKMFERAGPGKGPVAFDGLQRFKQVFNGLAELLSLPPLSAMAVKALCGLAQCAPSVGA